MKKKIRTILWFLFLLAIPFTGTAGLLVDAQDTAERSFSESRYKKLQNKKEYEAFLEYEKPINKDESWVSILFFKMVEFIFGSRILKFIFSIFPYLLIIAAFVLIILKLSNIELSSLFKPKLRKQGASVFYDEEDIYDLDLDKLLDDAIQNKDYKLATRYNYLKTLKILSDHEKIKWEIYKTNIEYQYELKKETYSSVFSDLTRYFEYIWYGEFELDFVKYYNDSMNLSNQIIDNLNKQK